MSAADLVAGIRAAAEATEQPRRKQAAKPQALTPGSLVKQAKSKLAENRRAIKRLRAELRALEVETNQLARLVEAASPTKRRSAEQPRRAVTN